MSAATYKWGDLVWLDTVKHGRCKGIVLEPIGGSDNYPLVTYLSPCETMRFTETFPLRDISPRVVEPAPRMWRLPERGDTIRVTDKFCQSHGRELLITNVLWNTAYPIHAGGDLYDLSAIELVRLHDDPTPGDHVPDVGEKVEPVADPNTDTMHDPVNKPSHYRRGGIEVIDFLEAFLTPEQYEGYLLGSQIAYNARSNWKGSRDEDLRKAEWYQSRLVAFRAKQKES